MTPLTHPSSWSHTYWNTGMTVQSTDGKWWEWILMYRFYNNVSWKLSTGKSKVHLRTGHDGTEGYASIVSLTSALVGVGGQRDAPAAFPRERPGAHMRLAGSHGRSGRVRKISPTPGFDPRTVQPVASRYTDWAIPDYLKKFLYIAIIPFVWATKTYREGQLCLRRVPDLHTSPCRMCEIRNTCCAEYTRIQARLSGKWRVGSATHYVTHSRNTVIVQCRV